MLRTGPTAKNHLAPSVSSAEVEKRWIRVREGQRDRLGMRWGKVEAGLARQAAAKIARSRFQKNKTNNHSSG